MTQFSIHFDKPSKTYASGENLTGVVNIMSPSGSKIQSLRMVFKGAEKAFPNTYTIFNQKFFLIGHNQDGTFLNPGHNGFPFQFTLPQSLPPSHKGYNFKIAYSVQARIIKPSGSKEKVKEEFMIVCNSLNLSPIVAVSPQPLVRMNTQALSSSKFINVTLIIPKIGFIRGELVPMQVQIENMSRCTTDGVLAVLQRTVKYTGPLSEEEESETLVTQHGPLRTVPYSREMLNMNELQIPWDLPPSSFSCSRYFRIKYDILISIKVKGGKDMCLGVPIIVGTHYGAAEEAEPA